MADNEYTMGLTLKYDPSAEEEKKPEKVPYVRENNDLDLSKPVDTLPSKRYSFDRTPVPKAKKVEPDPLELNPNEEYSRPVAYNGKATDYGEDQMALQYIGKAVDEGINPEEAFKGVGDEDTQMKFKVLAAKKFHSTGVPMDQAMEAVGLNPKLYEESQNVMSRFRHALDADQQEIVSGAMSLIASGSDLIYNDLGMGDDRIQQAVKRQKQQADANVEQAEQARRFSEELSSFYNHFEGEYDEVTGRYKTAVDVQTFTGNAAIDVAVGAATGGMVKGATEATRAAKQAATEISAISAIEIARFGAHKNVARAAANTASGLGMSALGLWLTKRFMPRDITNLKTKSADELDDILNGLELAKDKGLNIGSEDLMRPGSVEKQVKLAIDRGELNEAEAEQLINLYTQRHGELMGAVKGTLDTLGIKDVAKLKAFRNGEIALNNMPDEFKKWWGIQQQLKFDTLDPMYKEIEKMAQTNGMAGGAMKWNITELNERLQEITRSSPEVQNLIRRQFKFLAHSPKEGDSARAKYFETYYRKKKKVSNELATTSDRLTMLQDTYDKMIKTKTATQIALERSSKPSMRAKLSANLVKREGEIDKLLPEIKKFKLMRGNAKARLDRLEDNYELKARAYESESMPEEFDFTQLMDLSKRINQKLYASGGDISRSNPLQAEMLNEAKDVVDDFITSVVAKTDPDIVTKYKAATAKSREFFDSFGNSSIYRKVQDVTKNGTREELLDLFKGKSGPEYLRILKQAAGPESDLYKNTFAHVVENKIMHGVSQGSGIKNIADFNYGQFAANIRNPEVRQLIVENLGRDAYKELTGVAWLSETLGDSYKSIIGKVTDLVVTDKRWTKTFAGNTLSNRVASRLAWAVDRYSMSLIKTNPQGGNANINVVAGAIRNALADAIEVRTHLLPSGKTVPFTRGLVKIPGVPSIPNKTYTINQAMRDVKRAMVGMEKNPEAKKKFLDKFVESFAKQADKLNEKVLP